MKVLAIETSCDDTSVAVVDDSGRVHAVLSRNQDSSHQPFGGIVPEIACRNHTQFLLPLIDDVLRCSNTIWDGIDGICVTSRPGLIGSLLVGVVTAKSLALALGKPLIGVNHLEGHLLAPYLMDAKYTPRYQRQYPSLGLVISGGHTSLYRLVSPGKYLLLGETVDDAAGEAFDKLAKMLGLGFPGGAVVDFHAQSGSAQAFEFPRPMMRSESLNFSFSGLKTAAYRMIHSLSIEEIKAKMNDLCASYQEAIVDVLLAKLALALKRVEARQVIVTGGVSANSRLRQRATEWADENKIDLLIPPLRFCTDNAAMIGLAGIERLMRNESDTMQLGPHPQSIIGDFQ